MPTLARLEDAFHYVASCVAQHGEAYLPLFERLEAEITQARARESAVDRARRLHRIRTLQPVAASVAP